MTFNLMFLHFADEETEQVSTDSIHLRQMAQIPSLCISRAQGGRGNQSGLRL